MLKLLARLLIINGQPSLICRLFVSRRNRRKLFKSYIMRARRYSYAKVRVDSSVKWKD